MKVHRLEALSQEELESELSRGGRFVVYYYTISVGILTFRRSSDIYYIAPGKSMIAPGLPWMALSLLAGWWGIPWGPIYTIQSIWVNARGGRDMTREVAAVLTNQAKKPATIMEATM
jgi:hypothetical protein